MTDTKWKIGAKYKSHHTDNLYEYIGSSPSGKPILKCSGGIEMILNAATDVYKEVREPRRMKVNVLEATGVGGCNKGSIIFSPSNIFSLSNFNEKYWKKIDEIEWVEKI